jgi:hypothetical protein
MHMHTHMITHVPIYTYTHGLTYNNSFVISLYLVGEHNRYKV